MEKIICLNFVEERTQKCARENREWQWYQIKSIYRLHLDLVVKQLYYISCLNACATNCATFRIQKLCCGTVLYNRELSRPVIQGIPPNPLGYAPGDEYFENWLE